MWPPRGLQLARPRPERRELLGPRAYRLRFKSCPPPFGTRLRLLKRTAVALRLSP
jgi:hypothetical protein